MDEISKITEKDIRKFVKDLEVANTTIWNAICEAENIVKSDIFRTYRHLFDGERTKFLIKIAKAYKKLEHNDDSFAEPALNDAYFSDFEQFTSDLQEAIDNIES